jgi:hypothetical protein
LAKALSEFAEYVEKQQALRYPSTAGPSATTDDHAELDILNSLDLAETVPQVRLKELLLSQDEDKLEKLVDLLRARIDEGHGETVFVERLEVTCVLTLPKLLYISFFVLILRLLS